MDRLERLVNLVAALLDSPRPISREELRERVGGYQGSSDTFRRNFERDKDVLRQMGIPLVVEPVDRHYPEGPEGYRIPRERYELPDPGLSVEELAALRLAASAVQVGAGMGFQARTRAVMKLAGAGGPGSPDGLEDAAAPSSEGVGSLAEVPLDERVNTLFGAVADRATVRFRYRGAERRVDPWRLAYRSGHWYLAGWDHDRQAERLFRVDRLEAPQVGAAGAFGPPPRGGTQPPPPWRLGDEEEVAVTLDVDSDQGDWAATALGVGEGSERRPDGSWRFVVPVTNLDAFRSFVLGFLDHAEVVGPPAVRASFVAWLENLARARPPASPASGPPAGAPR